jgi:hypothetical protein
MNGAAARELRTTEQLKAEYQFPSIRAVQKWLRRHRIPVLRRGRALLADLRDVEQEMRRLVKA